MRVTVQRATRSLLLLALCFTNAVAQSAALRQPGTPRSLTNAEFWTIVSSFSEEGGIFPSDNYTSNELMIGQVASDLIARGKTGGAYLGVGPEQNFTYIAAMKPDIVFIVDIRRQAVMQHLMYKAIFELSGNRSEFIARLFSKPVQQMTAQDTSIKDIWTKYMPVPAETALYKSNIAAIHDHLAKTRGFALTSADSASIARVYDTFYRYGPHISYNSRAGGFLNVMPNANSATFLSLTLITDTSGVARSFLASEANYRFIKELHSKNLFIPVVGDFGGPQALRKVGDYLREHRTVVAGYYTSNVEQYLFTPPPGGSFAAGWREYYTSVGFMPLDSSSVFIRPNGLRVNSARVIQTLPGMPEPSATPDRSTFTVQMIGPPTPRPPRPPAPPQTLPPVTQNPNLGSITGVVRDSASGRPVASATIQIAGTIEGAITDSTGLYTIPNVAPGMHGLTLKRVGYAAVDIADIRVAAGTPTTVDFRARAQALQLSGVISTSVTFGGSAGSLSGVTLCPMMEFLAAFTAGRVQRYTDATNCTR